MIGQTIVQLVSLLTTEDEFVEHEILVCNSCVHHPVSEILSSVIIFGRRLIKDKRRKSDDSASCHSEQHNSIIEKFYKTFRSCAMKMVVHEEYPPLLTSRQGRIPYVAHEPESFSNSSILREGLAEERDFLIDNNRQRNRTSRR